MKPHAALDASKLRVRWDATAWYMPGPGGCITWMAVNQVMHAVRH